jgi:hypothetical protein
MTKKQPMFKNAEVIHAYTRADAVRDGVLIDVSATAKEAGIHWLVALSCAVWERCVSVPAGVPCQDEAGRLWDVLVLLRLGIGRSNGGTEIRFAIHVRDNNREGITPLVPLRALSGPYDEGGPVITVMFPKEN